MPLMPRRADHLPRGHPGRLAGPGVQGRPRDRHGRRPGAVAALAPQDHQAGQRARAPGREGVRRHHRRQPAPARAGCPTASTWARCCSIRCTASWAGGCGCSSAAARRCQPDVMKAFRGLGFKLFEGYGMTEAAPVLTAPAAGREDPDRQRGPGAARHRRAHRRSRRARRRRGDRQGAQRDAGLLRERRGHPLGASATAGCTPATWAGSTTTATSTSSGARRR